MIRHSMHEINLAKPVVSKIKWYFLFESPFWFNSIEITDQEHFYQNNRINRFSSNIGIIGGCLFVYEIKVYMDRSSLICLKRWSSGIIESISRIAIWICPFCFPIIKMPSSIDILIIPYKRSFLFSLSTDPNFHTFIQKGRIGTHLSAVKSAWF